ncbi:beta-N-acetylhexosaminidase [Polaribacter sp.]|uniref:beta-N-acetylhexosaminidase n=1 Tax=Polaribacter sp. TaxID=1920175 RepID=UPI0025FE1C68|nr:beta-N-acetylhexosaminidase [Polaribacter sp.]
MKSKLLILSVVFFVSCSVFNKQIKNNEEDYQVIPKPLKLTKEDGKFVIGANTKIIAVEELANEANFLKQLLLPIKLEVSKNSFEKDAIELKLDTAIENDEAYFLEINPKKITIRAKTSRGVFYGIQTLRQLLPPEIETQVTVSNLSVPAVAIYDEPRFKYRGMHLDVGRHFSPVAFIKKYIDLIAFHKMNTFHWHLTEDQGWRIEIKKYPKLTEVGAFRKETLVGHARNKGKRKFDGKPYGGFYTQEEVKEIVAYASSKHITVIPEIELPGHSLAAIASYPHLGNTGKQYEVGTRWGVFKEIYAPKEETFQFLEDVLTEVIALFPSKLIHIGGDEAPKKQWKESQYAQEIIKREGLKDEHELQSYFIKRIEKFLNSKGRNIIGWDEILEGGLAPNVAVMSWRGTKGGIAAAKQKHNVVMTPNHSCYFDHYQVTKEERANEPIAIGGKTTVKDVYDYEPMPKNLEPEFQKYILGAQANVWTEYITTSDKVEYMILPRMTALSEVVWSAKEQKSYPDFNKRLKTLSKRFDAMKLNYAKHSLK